MEEIKSTAASPVPSFVKPLVGDEEPSSSSVVFSKTSLVVFLVVAMLGVVTGFGVYAWTNAGTTTTKIAGRDVEIVSSPTEEGVKDAATFKDTATGELIANDGKLTGEGTHILKRGDVSQNVYLTSSVVDMSKYEGKRVQVWGETYKGQAAAWLMDVGRMKVQ